MISKDLSFIAKHFSIYAFGSILGQAVSFFLLPLYTRYLTPADYGVLALVNVTTDIIGIIISLGIDAALIRFYFDYDKESDKNLVVSTTYWITFISAIICIPMVIYISGPLSQLVFHSSDYRKYFVISIAALLVNMNVGVGFAYLRIKAMSVKFIYLSLLNMILSVGFNIYFVVFLKTGVIGILYSALIYKAIFSLLIGIPIIAQVGTRFSASLAKVMVSFSVPMIFSSIFRAFINESDKFFINYFFSPFETGIYSICQKIGTATHALIISPFLQVYMPRRFEIAKNENAKQTFATILDCFFVLICFIGLAISILSNCIVHLMTTEKFFSAAQYIPLSVLSMIIFSLKYHFELGIMIEKKTKYIAYINGISSFVNVTLNFILISKMGLWGALISLNITYVVTSLMNYIISQKMYYIKYNFVTLTFIITLAIIIFAISLITGINNILIGTVFNLTLLLIYLIVMYYYYRNNIHYKLGAIINTLKG